MIKAEGGEYRHHYRGIYGDYIRMIIGIIIGIHSPTLLYAPVRKWWGGIKLNSTQCKQSQTPKHLAEISTSAERRVLPQLLVVNAGDTPSGHLNLCIW